MMIDCGFGPRYVLRSLKELGLDLSRLSGVLLTHTHRDHIDESMFSCLADASVPVFSPGKIARVLIHQSEIMKEAAAQGVLRSIEGDTLEIGSYKIGHFQVPHDSPGGCFGYTLTKGAGSAAEKITVATDMGYTTTGLVEHFANSDIIIVESNHDREMLQNSRRPVWLKRRISEIGHLSNDQCAAFVADVVHHSDRLPRTVVLAHISKVCNTHALAERCTRDALDKLGHGEVEVVPAHRMKPTDVMGRAWLSSGTSKPSRRAAAPKDIRTGELDLFENGY
jgi:phosphoribosyl 1,2-cyclic phosphodiesterase